MNSIDAGKYDLALSVLNGMVGLCFSDLRGEQSKPIPDQDAIERLTARFLDYYEQRDRIAFADGATLQTIIDELGSQVRAAGSAPANNPHDVLDSMKHRISCEVLSRFTVSEIRERSIKNLERWRAQGTWSKAYDEWLEILKNPDDLVLISSMIGTEQRSNQLRQSMPYVGILDQHIVQKIHKCESLEKVAPLK